MNIRLRQRLDWLRNNLKYVPEKYRWGVEAYWQKVRFNSVITDPEQCKIEHWYALGKLAVKEEHRKQSKVKLYNTLPPVTTFNTTAGQPLGVKIGLDYVLSVDEAIVFINEINKAINKVVDAKPVEH